MISERTKIILITLFSILLVLICIIALFQNSEPYFSRDFSIWNFYQKYDHLTSPGRDPVVLVIGPSWTLFGVNGSQIEDEIQEKYYKRYQVFNLGSPLKHAFEWVIDLDEIISHKPCCVVILVSYVDFLGTGNMNARFHSLHQMYGNTLSKSERDLLNSSIRLEASRSVLYNQTLLGRFIEGYNLTKEHLQNSLFDPDYLDRIDFYSNYKDPVYKDDKGKNMGQMSDKAKTILYQKEFLKYYDYLKEHNLFNPTPQDLKNTSLPGIFTYSQKNQRTKLVSYVCQELKKNGISIIIANVPRDQIWEDLLPNITKERYHNFLSTFWPNYYDLTGRYPSSDFLDKAHLNEKGRMNLSSDLAEIISKECSYIKIISN